MDIIFRVYNDGAAFRYLIKGQKGKLQCTKLTITDEKTEYRFAQSAEIWSFLEIFVERKALSAFRSICVSYVEFALE